MAEAIIVRNYGGPEVLQLENIPSPDPKPDELLIRQTAIGINFHDIYCRSGLRKSLSLPGTPGIEGAGICLLYTSPSPRDATLSRMPSSA